MRVPGCMLRITLELLLSCLSGHMAICILGEESPPVMAFLSFYMKYKPR